VGQELGKLDKQTQAEIGRLEGRLKDLTSSREWEIAQGVVDAAGIVDPTPISDGISAVMSLASGDFIGAGLSAVSMIPYLGDAVAKTAKGARALKKLKELTEGIADAMKKLDALKGSRKALDNRKEAARRVREQRKHAANACKGCDPEVKYGSQLPTRGTWSGDKGNSKWTSEDGKYSIDYKDGYPDFSTAKTPDGRPAVHTEVEIPQTGKNSTDFSEANKAAGFKETPEGYTWHHKEDGVTMQLVDSKVHDRSMSRGGSGASHTGGASVVKDPQF
jgi:DNase/tRNase domain of colicin-like bacteriocin